MKSFFIIVWITLIIPIFAIKTSVKDFKVYTGVIFNFSAPNFIYNNRMSWLQASNQFISGLALPSMAGMEIPLTGRHGMRYQLSVLSGHQLWTRNTLADHNKCAHPLESNIIVIIRVTKRNVSALGVSDRVGLVSSICRTVCLPDFQHVVLTTPEWILSSEILAFNQSIRQDSFYFVSRVCCRYETVESVVEKISKLNENFRGIIREIRSIKLHVPWRNGASGMPSRHRRFVGRSKTYHIVSTLSPLKIVDTQIMNYVIPNTVFPLYSYPNGVNLFYFVNKSRELLTAEMNLWLKFTPSTRNIKFQPTTKNRGIHNLEICSNTLSSNESCVSVQVIVISSSPQVHQIHIREGRNDYIINYTLPLVWFRPQKVIKSSQIQITRVKASIPISWGNHNSLLFLNISSIEGTVLEFMVDVLVNNKTFVQLELMMPLMSLAKSRAIIYQFRSSITWLKYPFNVPKILILELNSFLNTMATRISQLLVGNSRVSILPLQIFRDNFDSIYIQRRDFTFDWTFFVNSELPKSCLISPESIVKSFEKLSTKNVINFNTSAIVSKSTSGCGLMRQALQTTSLPITRKRSTTGPLKTPTVRTDFQWRPIRIPDSKLFVECGIIFQCLLPAAISGIQEMFITPVVFTGPKPDWIGFSNNNKSLVGVIAKTICPKREFRFMINGSNYKKQVIVNWTLIIEISTPSSSRDQKFQIDMAMISIITFDVIQIIKTIKELKRYTQLDCEEEISCKYNISLVRPPTKNDETIHMSLEILDYSRVCPQILGIFLRNKLIETPQRPNSPNPQLKRIFYRYGIGQLNFVSFQLRGKCENKRIFPPDLGEKIIFNNIPYLISLKSFHEFYNSSVELEISNISSNGIAYDNYMNWIKIKNKINDSSILYILASTEHTRSHPYIVELTVNPGKRHKMLLPKISFQVKNLMHHPSFIPYIRELNHQISIDVTTNVIIEDTIMPLDITLEVAALADNYMRPSCQNASSLDCGADILIFLNSVIETQEGSNINYKLSSVQLLNDGNSTEISDLMNQKLKCPIKKLSRMEVKLKRAFYEYRQVLNNNSNISKEWIIDFMKVIYMGPCVHSETAYVKINEDIPPVRKDVPKENKIYFENTQHMFLMATVIPAASFICITLILGITTACLLSRRNRKKQFFNSSTLKIQADYPQVIFQSDTDTYSPPSKPLILQNEKPPQPLPDDEDDYDGILIPNVQSMKFYRPNI